MNINDSNGYILHDKDGFVYGAYNTRKEAVDARSNMPNKDEVQICREEIFRKYRITSQIKTRALNFMLSAL